MIDIPTDDFEEEYFDNDEMEAWAKDNFNRKFLV